MYHNIMGANIIQDMLYIQWYKCDHFIFPCADLPRLINIWNDSIYIMLRHIASYIINNDRYKMKHPCYTKSSYLFNCHIIILFNMIQFISRLNTLQNVSYKMIQIGTSYHVHILIIINTVLMWLYNLNYIYSGLTKKQN